jgi:heterodisulfide reductase subunit A-like polyferredoxin
LPNVVAADEYISMCTEGGADFIKENMAEHNANRLIVAA